MKEEGGAGRNWDRAKDQVRNWTNYFGEEHLTLLEQEEFYYSFVDHMSLYLLCVYFGTNVETVLINLYIFI